MDPEQGGKEFRRCVFGRDASSGSGYPSTYASTGQVRDHAPYWLIQDQKLRAKFDWSGSSPSLGPD